jgi:lipopolysaccharide/colanic/teichoic acid biosynthesis glycosyltransferase
LPDGGVAKSPLSALQRLGGLSTVESVLRKHDIDTVLLGFDQPDREEFFGALSTCYELGVRAMVHRDQADSVLVADAAGGELVDTDLSPLDWQDYVIKRLFDISFAVLGLLLLSPVILCIVVLVKLDSPGPVLYTQRRTAEFGETFRIFKFRSMVPEAEADSGATLSAEDAGGRDPRVTRVGRVLRLTHLDEIPQLWSVLRGDMSVVGPRPERPELDADIETNVNEWRSRWFVKPGLTGLAQINDVTGYDPERKLRYDIEYIRNQSLWYDLQIVIRQIYEVFMDVRSLLRRAESEGSN